MFRNLIVEVRFAITEVGRIAKLQAWDKEKVAKAAFGKTSRSRDMSGYKDAQKKLAAASQASDKASAVNKGKDYKRHIGLKDKAEKLRHSANILATMKDRLQHGP